MEKIREIVCMYKYGAGYDWLEETAKKEADEAVSEIMKIVEKEKEIQTQKIQMRIDCLLNSI